MIRVDLPDFLPSNHTLPSSFHTPLIHTPFHIPHPSKLHTLPQSTPFCISNQPSHSPITTNPVIHQSQPTQSFTNHNQPSHSPITTNPVIHQSQPTQSFTNHNQPSHSPIHIRQHYVSQPLQTTHTLHILHPQTLCTPLHHIQISILPPQPNYTSLLVTYILLHTSQNQAPL